MLVNFSDKFVIGETACHDILIKIPPIFIGKILRINHLYLRYDNAGLFYLQNLTDSSGVVIVGNDDYCDLYSIPPEGIPFKGECLGCQLFLNIHCSGFIPMGYCMGIPILLAGALSVEME